MAMMFQIVYREEVVEKDIPSLSPDVKKIVKAQIEKKLTIYPAIFGKPLRNMLFGLWSLRVGDYRVVYKITLPHTVTIAVIRHRSKAYFIAEKRA